MKKIAIVVTLFILACNSNYSDNMQTKMANNQFDYLKNKEYILQNNWQVIGSFNTDDYFYPKKKEFSNLFLYEESNNYKFKEGLGCIVWDIGPEGYYIFKDCKCQFNKDTFLMIGKSFSGINEKWLRRYIVVNNILLMYTFNLSGATYHKHTCLIEVYSKSKIADSMRQVLQKDTFFLLPYYDSIMKRNDIKYELEK